MDPVVAPHELCPDRQRPSEVFGANFQQLTVWRGSSRQAGTGLLCPTEEAPNKTLQAGVSGDHSKFGRIDPASRRVAAGLVASRSTSQLSTSLNDSAKRAPERHA